MGAHLVLAGLGLFTFGITLGFLCRLQALLDRIERLEQAVIDHDIKLATYDAATTETMRTLLAREIGKRQTADVELAGMIAKNTADIEDLIENRRLVRQLTRQN